MPLASIIVGLILIDLAFRGTEHGFAKQLGADFGGGTKFWSWAAAIGIIGSIGYVKGLEKISGLLLALVLLVIVLVHGGLFEQLAALAVNPPPATPAVPLSKYGSPSGGGSGGGSGGQQSSNSGGGGGGQSDEQKAASAASTAAEVIQIAALFA